MQIKTFEHDLVELVDMPSYNEGDARYYVIPNAEKREVLPSVTTVLAQAYGRGWVDEWKARVGDERADVVMNQARTRGRAVHSLCEGYLRNEPNFVSGAMPSNLYTFLSLKQFIDRRVGLIRAIEAPLYSRRLRTAGRTDLVAEVDGIDTIVDFKTGSTSKVECQIESYFIQSACYGEMFEELTGRPIKRIAVVMAPDDSSSPVVFVRDRERYRDAMLAIFVKGEKRS